MLNIEELKIVVKELLATQQKEKSNAVCEATGLRAVLLNLVFKQTKLNAIDDVQLVLNLFEAAETTWLKDGLKNILLCGGFPAVTSREVGMGNTDNPSIFPTQPVVWPTTVPPVKFEPYCNDYKTENLTKVK